MSYLVSGYDQGKLNQWFSRLYGSYRPSSSSLTVSNYLERPQWDEKRFFLELSLLTHTCPRMLSTRRFCFSFISPQAYWLTETPTPSGPGMCTGMCSCSFSKNFFKLGALHSGRQMATEITSLDIYYIQFRIITGQTVFQTINVLYNII